jgi:hypothetical protein
MKVATPPGRSPRRQGRDTTEVAAPPRTALPHPPMVGDLRQPSDEIYEIPRLPPDRSDEIFEILFSFLFLCDSHDEIYGIL